jgi:quercetin dioxygenase-like cupin family protein
MALGSSVPAYQLEAEGGERLRFGEVEIVVKASAETTSGRFTIFEENEPVDTPLHIHQNEDELFYVLEGEHVFQVGDQEFHAGPGGVVFATRRPTCPAAGNAADRAHTGPHLPRRIRRLLPRARRGTPCRCAWARRLRARLHQVRHHLAQLNTSSAWCSGRSPSGRAVPAAARTRPASATPSVEATDTKPVPAAASAEPATTTSAG